MKCWWNGIWRHESFQSTMTGSNLEVGYEIPSPSFPSRAQLDHGKCPEVNLSPNWELGSIALDVPLIVLHIFGTSYSLHLIDLNFKFRFRNRCKKIAPTLQAFYQIPLISISQCCDLFLKTNEFTLMSNFLKLLPHSDFWSTGCWREVVCLNHCCILSLTHCVSLSILHWYNF